jgi:hypothetical protein
MEWKFESGIVGVRSNVFGTFCQRVYHVRYSSDTHLRRLITASFTYTKLVSSEKEKILTSLVTGDMQEFNKAVGTTGVIIPDMSEVVAIMDFDIHERDQHPPNSGEVRGSFHEMHNHTQDINDFTSLAHFEINLSQARYRKCVCTLTNDEESKKRIDEILSTNTKESCALPVTSQLSNECLENPELTKALQRIFELEAIVIQQRHTIEDLKSKVN